VNDVPQRDSNTGQDTKQQPLPYRKIEGEPRDILLRRYKCPFIRLLSQWWESLSVYKHAKINAKESTKTTVKYLAWFYINRRALNLHRVYFTNLKNWYKYVIYKKELIAFKSN